MAQTSHQAIGSWQAEKVEAATSDTTMSATSGQTLESEQPWTIRARPGSRQTFKSNFAKTWWLLLLSIFSLALLAIIVLFVQSSKYAEEYSHRKARLTGILKTDASTTLAVLRTAQAVLSTIMSACLGDAMELLQWAMMNTPKGMPFSGLLALSSATGKIAMTRLLFSDAAGAPARLWTMLRCAQAPMPNCFTEP